MKRTPIKVMKEVMNKYDQVVAPNLLQSVKYTKKNEYFEDMAAKFPLNGVTPKIVKNDCYEDFSFKKDTIIRFVKEVGIDIEDKYLNYAIKEFITNNDKNDYSIFSEKNDCVRLKMNGVLLFISKTLELSGMGVSEIKDIITDCKAYMYHILYFNNNKFCDKMRMAEKSYWLNENTTIVIDDVEYTVTNRVKKKMLKDVGVKYVKQ